MVSFSSCQALATVLLFVTFFTYMYLGYWPSTKSVTGRLSAFDDDSVTLTPDGGEPTVLPRKAVSRLSTVYED